MKDRKYCPGNYSFKENVYLCKNITSMSLQDHEIFMQYFDANDQRPKNGGCEEGFVPVEEWYKPHKHKEKLIELFHSCMLSGYEIDRTSFFDNYNRTYYYVYMGRVTVKISTGEYGRLWIEAADSFEEWLRSISKQGPTYEEVRENYIAPRPRSGKLPYVGRERSRKYGNEELLKKLMEKYSQGTTAMSDRFTFMEENNHETNV